MEGYGLNWKGKAEARAEAALPAKGLLDRLGGSGSNMYIEGDNLEALKLLRGEFESKIKLIYIDPPYSTGKDFIYNDKFKTGGNAQDGHSAWLSMIYPRLIAARELLREDGVIFISIDDREFKNLAMVCDEVFDGKNFIANIIWERSAGPVNLMKHLSANHEYVLCYAKNKKFLVCNGLKRSGESTKRYKNPDNDPRGPWMRSDLSVGPAVRERVYEITTPSGRKVMPPSGRCWQIPRERYDEYVRDGRIWFGRSNNSVPSIKRFLADVKTSLTPVTIWKREEVGTTQDAKRKLKKLFDGKAVFEYPKPTQLIMRMLELYTGGDDIVLDFFSGSGTTAEAVMRQNAADNGNRRFICVQASEKCGEGTIALEAGYANIYEIGKERILRAGRAISQALPEGNGSCVGFLEYKVIAKKPKHTDGGDYGVFKNSLENNI